MAIVLTMMTRALYEQTSPFPFISSNIVISLFGEWCDCNDNDDATIDLCSGDGTVERSCTNELTVQCSAGDNYCPEGCFAADDPDCFVSETKIESEEVSISTDNCNEEGKVENKSFCQGGIWRHQKAGSSSCSEDYQCQTGVCKEDGSCLANNEISEQRKTLITSMVIAGFLALIGTYLFYLLYYFITLFVIKYGHNF